MDSPPAERRLEARMPLDPRNLLDNRSEPSPPPSAASGVSLTSPSEFPSAPSSVPKAMPELPPAVPSGPDTAPENTATTNLDEVTRKIAARRGVSVRMTRAGVVEAFLRWQAAGSVPEKATDKVILGCFFEGYRVRKGFAFPSTTNLQLATAGIRALLDQDIEPSALLCVADWISDSKARVATKPEALFGEHWDQLFGRATTARDIAICRNEGRDLHDLIEERRKKDDERKAQQTSRVGFGMNFDDGRKGGSWG